jgi:uncharacterized protein
MARAPAVLLLGPRQVGKSTLAQTVAASRPGAVMLDLERASDRAQLAEPELFFARHREHLVVLDEVQLMPELFSTLRPEIDAARRPGRFLLLGSASGELLRQKSESLAGRIGYLELPPVLALEQPDNLAALQQLWLRGGFPLSLLAADEAASFGWRQDFIESFLLRDLAQMGVKVAAESLHRFWRMQAHLQGQPFNASALGASLGGLAHTTVARYLDTLVDALMLRRLEPVLPNLGKRLIKSPKVYVRDSGLVHALLGLKDLDALQAPPHRRHVVGRLRHRAGGRRRGGGGAGRAAGLLPHRSRHGAGRRHRAGRPAAGAGDQVLGRAHGGQGLLAGAGRSAARTRGGRRAGGATLSVEGRRRRAAGA